MKTGTPLYGLFLLIAGAIAFVGTANADAPRVNVMDDASFGDYTTAYLAVTAENAQGHPFVQELLEGIAGKGFTAKLGFPPNDAAREGSMTIFLREFGPAVGPLEIFVMDSDTEKGLAKINADGNYDAEAQGDLIAAIIKGLFGDES